MQDRPFWVGQIKQAWERRSIVWLSGVRRVGKTTLAKMFEDAIYLNCDLPSVTRMLSDPESYYDSLDKNVVVILDEVHRVEDSSLLLKIAADEYPEIRILATGSSTFAATQKFRDTLTGRKVMIYLPPVLWRECTDVFGIKDLDHRLLCGGLPEPLLAITKDEAFFSEWMDSFYARDIQEIFSIRNRVGFMKLLRLLLHQSGGLMDYTNLAKLSDLSRPTVKAHVEAMEIAHAVFLLPPYHGRGRREIIQRPKCYGFDTGIVTFINGWDSIRETDRGLLWEHLVLDTLRAHFHTSNLHYWRDKSGREIDFVLEAPGGEVHSIECKITPDQFNSKSLSMFRALYPAGENFVVSPALKVPYKAKYDKLRVNFCSLNDLPITS